MPSEGELKKRVVRKLTKKRKEGHQVTMEIPERFRDGDDAEEDCTAPKGQNIYMNQSVFGMIAAAGGSQVNFNARFDGPSSDDEESGDVPSRGDSAESITSRTRPGPAAMTPDNNRRQFSESKLMRSLPQLSIRPFKPRSKTRPAGSPVRETQEVENQPSPTIEVTASRGTPVMGRMLKAQAELSSRPSFELSRRPSEKPADDSEDGSTSLARRLMEIFGFDSPEEVIEG
jgi:sterol 3beta-glucosyltransferase